MRRLLSEDDKLQNYKDYMAAVDRDNDGVVDTTETAQEQAFRLDMQRRRLEEKSNMAAAN
jgi:hypothetical protein